MKENLFRSIFRTVILLYAMFLNLSTANAKMFCEIDFFGRLAARKNFSLDNIPLWLLELLQCLFDSTEYFLFVRL